MARSTILPAVVLAISAAVLVCSALSFVGPNVSTQGVRGSQVAMEAQKLAKRKLPTGPYSVSVEPLRSGATNEVSIVTPPISSEGVQEYLSLAPVFFMALAIFTSGFAIEVLRFFPDTRYW
mmetsp:Transcript_21087/g.29769  ORF Transcript_21087/g.29769 Transcript_21087/m.29769 type:complete len:121 (+) Transcript_21087:17-379(+)